MILKPVVGGDAHRLVRRMARDRSERVLIAHAPQRPQRGRLARGVLGDAGERLAVRERIDRGAALRLAQPFERLERDVAQHVGGLRPDMFVRIVARDRCQGGRVHQLRHRGAPDAGVGVLAGDLGQQFALLERDLLHKGEADGGVGVLVPGLCAESIEQCHGALQPDARQLVTRAAAEASPRPAVPSASPRRRARATTR